MAVHHGGKLGKQVRYFLLKLLPTNPKARPAKLLLNTKQSITKTGLLNKK